MLQAARFAGWESFDIKFDYYWVVLEDRYNPYGAAPRKEGAGMGFGSLVDDIQSLQKILYDEEHPVSPIDFKRLGYVLVALSDHLYASGRVWIIE